MLFGGRGDTTTFLNDTWTYDGTAWTEQAPSVRPPTRGFAAMAYDAASDQVVLFGGLRGEEVVGDTWTYQPPASPVEPTMETTATMPSGSTPSNPTPSQSSPAPAASPVPPRPPATCEVPNLKGKKLKSAKKRIVAADCAIGKVKKRKGATAKGGKVIGESPGPGTEVPVGTKVMITLAPTKHPH